ARAIANVADASLQAQLLARLDIDVGATVEFLVPVPADDADIVVVAAREIVAVGVVAAVQARQVAVVLPGLEDRLVAGVDVVFVEIEADDLAGRTAAGRREDVAARTGAGRARAGWELAVEQPGAPLGILHPVGP